MGAAVSSNKAIVPRGPLEKAVLRLVGDDRRLTGQVLSGRDQIVAAFLDLADGLVLPRRVELHANGKPVMKALVAGRIVYGMQSVFARGADGKPKPARTAPDIAACLSDLANRVQGGSLSVHRIPGWQKPGQTGVKIAELAAELGQDQRAALFERLADKTADAGLAWIRFDRSGRELARAGDPDLLRRLERVERVQSGTPNPRLPRPTVPAVNVLPLGADRVLAMITTTDMTSLVAVVPQDLQFALMAELA